MIDEDHEIIRPTPSHGHIDHIFTNNSNTVSHSLSPGGGSMVSASVANAAKRWRKAHEQSIKEKLHCIKVEKRHCDTHAEAEVDKITLRKLPFDMLVKDWLKDHDASLDTRVYLLENLIPTLVLGLERILLKAKDLDLIDTCGHCKNFTPVNYLANFLMRNNPRYSNICNSSEYALSIKQLLKDLKQDAYQEGKNKLAKLKLEAKRRQEERERIERLNLLIRKGRPEALQDMFTEWTSDRKGVVALSLIQMALRSFQEYAETLSDELKRESMFAIEVEATDETGQYCQMMEFVDYIEKYTSSLSVASFNEFLRHLSNLAQEYRLSAELEYVRVLLCNLFDECDHGQSGQLDRKRIVTLLEVFYDNSKDPTIKSSLRNPRSWPVIEIEEQTVDEEVEPDEFENRYNESQDIKSQEDTDTITRKSTLTSATPIASETLDEDIHRESTDENIEGNNEGNKISDPVMKESSNSTYDIGKKSKSDIIATGTPNIRLDHNVQHPNSNVISNETEADNSSPAFKGSKENVSEDVPVGRIESGGIDQDLERETKEMIERASSSETSATPSKSRAFSVATAFDANNLNQPQFVNLLIKFLGEKPLRSAVESLVRYLRTGYAETEEERSARLAKARLGARSARRRAQIDQLFELWDIDGSGYLELDEIEVVLEKWREEGALFRSAHEVFEGAIGKVSHKQFKAYIEKICSMFPDEDVFESLISFLFASVERSFEERKRGELRRRWLQAIQTSSYTSGAQLEPPYRTTFHALQKDAEHHGRNKIISCYVCMLQRNENPTQQHRGETYLRYVSCTQEDYPYIQNKILYRDMKCVSFATVESGKPIHVSRVVHHGGVYLWNPNRKDEGAEGSFIVLPLKGFDRQVVGTIGIDTLSDPHEKSIFVTQEISFYQAVAKALSQAIQYVDIRKKTVKIAESAVSWILRRSPHVHEVNVYLVEPGLKVSDGLVLRKMVSLGQNNHCQRYKTPPRLERKDNLFRDYLFKCVDTSETLTADAYGERHTAFPLRDGDGLVVAIVDISIGELRQLPPHENKEIQRMLKLLAVAHREVSRESAGEEKNIVLEVEKQHQERRIDVLFDRIMLQDLRENVGRLDARAFAEIKSYKDPPKVVHDIVKAVLAIYFNGKEDESDMESKFEEWTTCKQLVNNDLVKWITTFDPTASVNVLVDGERLAKNLENVAPGTVAKHGSLPAQYLFNWAFVCLSLIEHTAKMREALPNRGNDTDSQTQDNNDS